jgi:hypothetical protein
MIRVPLFPVPNQTLAITLANQACEIVLRQNGANMFLDLRADGTPVVLTRVCRNKQRLLLDVKYRGFVGDFLFLDTQGDTQPEYTGLDSRYVLYYLEASDLE